MHSSIPNVTAINVACGGMLSRDIVVSTVTSRPGYLIDWKYDDITNVTGEGAIDTS